MGYARVSTDGQSVQAQVDALKTAGCSKVFKEIASGARTERAQLRRLLAAVEKGDTVVVVRLDRLARSTRDLLNIVSALAEKGADFRSLSDAWADTTSPHGRLLLTVLGGLAEFERSLILARTSEGRRRAVARGQKMGRPPRLNPHQRREVLARVDAGETFADIARSYAVDRSTISRMVSTYGERRVGRAILSGA